MISDEEENEDEMLENSKKDVVECRICLRMGPITNFQNLFTNWTSPWAQTRRSIIADDLNKLVNIELSPTDKLGSVICQGCCVRLYNACNFIVTVKVSDEILRNRHLSESTGTPTNFDLEGKPWPKPIQVDKNISRDLVNNSKEIEIKQEVISDDEYDADGYITEFGVHVKVEPNDEELLLAPSIKVTVNGTIPMEQMGTHSAIITNGDEVYEDIQFLDNPVKEEPLSEDDGQPPWELSLECLLCAKVFMSVSGLKAHVIANHSYKSVKRKNSNSSPERQQTERHVCSTCKRCFSTKTDLMVHETCHNQHTCYGCNMKFKLFDRLIKHRRKCKSKKEVVQPKKLEDVIRPVLEVCSEQIGEQNKDDIAQKEEVLTCSKCPETFSESYYMKIHNEIHHSSNANETSQPTTKSKTEQTIKIIKVESAQDKMETEALQNMFEQTDDSKIETHKQDNQNSKNCINNIKVESAQDKMEIEALQNMFKQTDDPKVDTDRLQDKISKNSVVDDSNVNVKVTCSDNNISNIEEKSDVSTGFKEQNNVIARANISTELMEVDVNIGKNSVDANNVTDKKPPNRVKFNIEIINGDKEKERTEECTVQNDETDVETVT